MVELAPYAMVIAGIGGLILAALRYNREDSTAAVAAAGNVMTQMQSLNDELVDTLARLRADLAEAHRERAALNERLTEARTARIGLEDTVAELRKEVDLLQRQVDELNGGGRA